MNDHLKKCLKRKFECSKCKDFEGVKDAFLEHIFTVHESVIFDTFDKNLIKDKEEEKKSPTTQNEQVALEYDRICKISN